MNRVKRCSAASLLQFDVQLVLLSVVLSTQSAMVHHTGAGSVMCDFDRKWSYETVACSRWTATVNSDDETNGFTVTGHRQTSNPTKTTSTCNSSELTSGLYALFSSPLADRSWCSATLLSPWLHPSSNASCRLEFTALIDIARQPRDYNVTGNILTADGAETTIRSFRSVTPTSGSHCWHKYTASVGLVTVPFRIAFNVSQHSCQRRDHERQFRQKVDFNDTTSVGNMTDDDIKNDVITFAIDNISLIGCDEITNETDYYPAAAETFRICDLHEFLCYQSSTCVPIQYVCDFAKDCPDGEDESDVSCSDHVEEVPAASRCDFESGFCDWNHVSADFRWRLRFGPTPTSFTGPKADHTYSNKSGHYAYIEATDGSLGHSAILESVEFDAPPVDVWDPNSPFYNACQLRFFYHMYGIHVYRLNVHVIQAGSDVTNRSDYRNYWTASKDGYHGWDEWRRATIPIPPLRGSYRIQFEGLRGLRFRGDIAIDDVSLSSECFGKGIISKTQRTLPEPITEVANMSMRYVFTTCGNTGWRGPTNSQCKAAYSKQRNLEPHNREPVVVRVVEDGPLSGAQIWTVPETATYGVTAIGASGGTGVRSVLSSPGGYVHAQFNFTKGQLIYMIVGQQGESACKQNDHESVDQTCRHFPGRTGSNRSPSPTHNNTRTDDTATYATGGGGGGGGGTFVFRVDPETNSSELLLVAGGGGGMSFDTSSDAAESTGGQTVLTSHQLQHHQSIVNSTATAGPRSGGSWPTSGISLLAPRWTPVGTEPCDKARRNGWKTAGGYGVGGGGCMAGGGGGGFIGGTASLNDQADENGRGGSSYVSPDGTYVQTSSGIHSRDGEGWVEILFVLECACEFLCLYYSYADKIYKCFCPPNYVLDRDQHHCIDSLAVASTEQDATSEQYNVEVVVSVFVCTAVFFLTFVVLIVYVAVKKWRRTRRNPKIIISISRPSSVAQAPDDSGDPFHNSTAGGSTDIRLRPMSDGGAGSGGRSQYLERLRHVVASSSTQLHRPGMITQFNPHYDFNGVNGADGAQPASASGGCHSSLDGSLCSLATVWNLDNLEEIPREHIVFTRALGQGAFGEVYGGILHDPNKETAPLHVAVKTLPALSTDQAEMDFLMEALIMSKFQHPNIVRFIGVCFNQHPRFIVLELLEGGDLKTFLRNGRPKPDKPCSLTIKDLLNLALNVAEGCRYLESNHFIHRDIAARNCLLTTTADDRIAKIADFGMARDIYRSDYYRKGGRAILPVKWMPPEAFLDGVFTTKTDVWSFGVLLWELFSLGFMPYPGRGNHEVMQLVASGVRLEAPHGCPPLVYEIMMACWHVIPTCRPDFVTIISRLQTCLQDNALAETKMTGAIFCTGNLKSTSSFMLRQPSSVTFPGCSYAMTNTSATAAAAGATEDNNVTAPPLMPRCLRSTSSNQEQDVNCSYIRATDVDDFDEDTATAEGRGSGVSDRWSRRPLLNVKVVSSNQSSASQADDNVIEEEYDSGPDTPWTPLRVQSTSEGYSSLDADGYIVPLIPTGNDDAVGHETESSNTRNCEPASVFV